MNMTPLKHIRTQVFGLTQVQFSEQLDVKQSTISKAETQGRISTSLQESIRGFAKNSGVAWNDSWFFEVPPDCDAS